MFLIQKNKIIFSHRCLIGFSKVGSSDYPRRSAHQILRESLLVGFTVAFP